MHADPSRVTRGQMMARRKANHIQVVYAPSKAKANEAMAAKIAMAAAMGIEVHVCGTGHGRGLGFGTPERAG